MFCHTHVHTYYSLLDALSGPDALASRAKELQQPALAITDHGVMYGVFEHQKACIEHGIKPLFGTEFYVTFDHKTKDKDDIKYAHLICIAMNETGYKNLLKLSSIAAIDGFYYKPRIDNKLLEQYAEGILCQSACLAGSIPRAIINNDMKTAEHLVSYYKELFKDRFFLEIQANDIPNQHVVNNALIELSDLYSVPLVATADVHYAAHSLGPTHKSFTTLGKNNDKEVWEQVYAHCWLKSEDEMKIYVPQESLDNTVHIADMCNMKIKTDELHFPEFQVPSGYTLDTYISKLCTDALFRYVLTNDVDINTYLKRLDYELTVIINKGLSGYFLIIWDFLNYARSKSIDIGPGRGSAAGSLVSFLLHITELDPIKYHLLFERFLNPERPSMPDIDLDINPDGEEEIINYLKSKYGFNNLCNIATFGKLKSRQALKDAGRILGYEFENVNNITKQIPVFDGEPLTIQQAIDTVPDIKKAAEEHPDLFGLALDLANTPKSFGMHAAGIIITPEELTEYIPLTIGKDDKVTSQFDKDMVEEQGLLKFDLLKLRTLKARKLTLNHIAENKNLNIDLNNIPLDDKDTLELIGKGNTIGVFQLESQGMQKIFKDLDNVTLDSLIDGVALFRPGPLSLIPSYVRRANGHSHIDYTVPELEPILKNTYGVILYQEQTMRIATDLAGFTPGQSDGFRKAVGKKKKDVMEKEIHKLIHGSEEEKIPGMIKNGIPEEKALMIAEMIEKFASYGFNRCLTKNTRVLTENGYITIEDLLEKTDPGLLISVDKNLNLVKNSMIDCFYSGDLLTYKVTLDNGQEIECTMSHEFLTENGFKSIYEILEDDLEIIKFEE